MKEGLLIVLSGPSGVGKGTVLKLIINDPRLNLVYSVSLTTRKPRENEVDGEHYHFVSKECFEECIENGDMLEYAQFVGNYYGTRRSDVEAQRAQGKNVLLEIEVQGALQVIEQYPDVLTIFIDPPSLDELEQRIRNRRREDEEVIAQRLEKAKKEIDFSKYYECCVVNDDPQVAALEITNIIMERMKS